MTVLIIIILNSWQWFLNIATYISLLFRDADGEWYTYSFGGYHADDDERTVLEADNSGGPFFKSTPIDVHKFEMGKERQFRQLPFLFFLVKVYRVSSNHEEVRLEGGRQVCVGVSTRLSIAGSSGGWKSIVF